MSMTSGSLSPIGLGSCGLTRPCQQWRHPPVTIHTGRAGPCAWSVIQGDLDEETLEGFLAHLRDVAEHVVPGQLVLDMCHDLSMPTPVQRQRIVEVLNGLPVLDQIGGHALVINSTIGRGLLTAINWVVTPRWEEKLFGSPQEAFGWLEEQNSEFDADALLRSVRATHPDFDQLRW